MALMVAYAVGASPVNRLLTETPSSARRPRPSESLASMRAASAGRFATYTWPVARSSHRKAGMPSLVLLGADAGVGKTRLVRHVAEVVSADGALVVTGHCVDLGEVGLPYLPFAEALGLLREADPAITTAGAPSAPR